ncbi:MAG: RsmE family RNA methyltransferase [Candidatus Paceibacterota bacterium]
MKIHRFFLNTGFLEGEISISDIEFVHQIRDVLKLHNGEMCVLFNAAGQEAQATITAYHENRALLNVEKITQREEGKTRIILYCAVLKRENFELVVQKATELGVSEIIPILTQRTIKTGLRKDRLEKIATEASEQSGRVSIPQIGTVCSFTEALEKAQDNIYTIVLHTGGERIAQEGKDKIGSIGVFIGPEGGFTDEEIQQAREYQYHIHTFPNMTLRAETAAIIGVFWAREIVNNKE